MAGAGQLLGVSVYAVSKGLKRLEGRLESDNELQRLMRRMSNVQTPIHRFTPIH